MISLEEIHLDSLIHKILEGGKDSNISLWHNISILIPEIPDITQKIQGSRLLGWNSTEEGDKASLTGSRISHLEPQVDI